VEDTFNFELGELDPVEVDFLPVNVGTVDQNVSEVGDIDDAGDLTSAGEEANATYFDEFVEDHFVRFCKFDLRL